MPGINNASFFCKMGYILVGEFTLKQPKSENIASKTDDKMNVYGKFWG
jgi:hypothetical protein